MITTFCFPHLTGTLGKKVGKVTNTSTASKTFPIKLLNIEYLYIFKPLKPKTLPLEQQVSNNNYNSKNRKLQIAGKPCNNQK